MRILSIGAALATAATVAFGQTSGQEIRKLSLEECIETALRHNLDIQIRRYSPEISRYSLKAAYGAYDPSLSLSGEHQYSLSAGGVDPQGRPYTGNESEADSFRAGVQGLAPWGMTYSLGANVTDAYGTRPSIAADLTQPFIVTNSFQDITTGKTLSYRSTNFQSVSIRSPFENSSGSMGALSLRQPLLKGFLVDSARMQIFLDKKNVEISDWDLRNQIVSTVTAVEMAYYNLIFAQESVRVQEKALELADRLLLENRKRVEVGALAPLDEKQSEAQAASSRADLLASQGNEDTAQRVLKNLLSDDYTKWSKAHVLPTLALIAVPQKFDLQESWQNGLRLRPDLVQQRISLEKQGYIVRYQKNQILPQLDVVGTYGHAGSSTEYSGVFNQFSTGDYPFWSYGGQVTMPLSQTSSRNSYRAAKATKEQIALTLRQLEQGVMIQIENAIASVNTSFQRVGATREARIYAEAALEAEQKKLASGKSTSFEVLRLQRDLTTSRSSEIRSLADYNIALAQLAQYEGTTLERRHVNLNIR